jgi:hypothetical protein
MEKKIKTITKNLKNGTITKDEADKILLDLFEVVSNNNLNLPKSFIDKIESWDDGGCSTGLND